MVNNWEFDANNGAAIKSGQCQSTERQLDLLVRVTVVTNCVHIDIEPLIKTADSAVYAFLTFLCQQKQV